MLIGGNREEKRANLNLLTEKREHFLLGIRNWLGKETGTEKRAIRRDISDGN